ncbi:MAG: 16S rRNA (uracil(1498)-N(3))-methyltransferase [Flavobacteriaceae bacterium]|nr:16S rRNA (uracil(1498)-N(3))-methyltransferase [Flavobacteriaceae bacterium]
MQLFFNVDINETDQEFYFPKEESKHIVRVLRKKEGDLLNITNGKGWLFEAEILSANQNKCTARTTNKHLQLSRAFKIHMVVAPTKMNDRYEWFLEKAVEIGVDTITPIICENSERKVFKSARFNRIIQSAMKQSLQCYLPKLNEPISFKEFLLLDIKGQKFIAHCEDSNKKSMKNSLMKGEDVTILIGPEGDFSVKEIEMALSRSYIPVTLGNTRLRTETAAIVACNAVVILND